MSEPLVLGGDGGSVDKLGIVTLEIKCEVDTLRECLDYDPGNELELPVAARQWRRQKHGKYELTISAEGVDDPAAAKGRTIYEIEGTTSEDSIESNPNIQQLVTDFLGQIKDSKLKFAPELEDGSRNPMFGVESYLVPGVVWTERTIVLEIPPDLLDGLGSIDDDPPGEPPSLPGDRNWLRIAADCKPRGNVFERVRKWLLSGPGGFVRQVYNYEFSK